VRIPVPLPKQTEEKKEGKTIMKSTDKAEAVNTRDGSCNGRNHRRKKMGGEGRALGPVHTRHP